MFKCKVEHLHTCIAGNPLQGLYYSYRPTPTASVSSGDLVYSTPGPENTRRLREDLGLGSTSLLESPDAPPLVRESHPGGKRHPRARTGGAGEWSE